MNNLDQPNRPSFDSPASERILPFGGPSPLNRSWGLGCLGVGDVNFLSDIVHNAPTEIHALAASKRGTHPMLVAVRDFAPIDQRTMRPLLTPIAQPLQSPARSAGYLRRGHRFVPRASSAAHSPTRSQVTDAVRSGAAPPTRHEQPDGFGLAGLVASPAGPASANPGTSGLASAAASLARASAGALVPTSGAESAPLLATPSATTASR